MKLGIAALSAVAIAAGASFPAMANWLTAQQTAPRPFRLVGQLTARVDPNRPIQIEVVNAGRVPIQALLTQPPTDTRRVLPNESITFGSTSQSFLPPPIYFTASPERSDIGLSMYVSATGNRLRIVIAQAPSDIPGNGAVIVERSGLVFVN